MTKEERIKKADTISEISDRLTIAEIEALVPESELVKKLPVLFHKKMTGEELDQFINNHRRFLAAEKMYNQEN